MGLTISLDYWWSVLNVAEDDPTYQTLIDEVHQRAADRLLAGCLQNGGLYIKLGQGLVSLNHILPTQYVTTLKVCTAWISETSSFVEKCLKVKT